MLLEHAILQIKPGASKVFEIAFQEAQGIISNQKGYLRHELQHCVEYLYRKSTTGHAVAVAAQKT